MKSIRVSCFALAVLMGGSLLASAEIIGMNVPAPSLTLARIEGLEGPEREAWRNYLLRSQAQMNADRQVVELERKGLAELPAPPPAAKQGNMPLDLDASWYGSDEALKIAANIISFQTPAGGWSKNQDRSGPARLPGQHFANDSETMSRDPSDFDSPRDIHWTFVGTFDNEATTTELRFLAKVAAQLSDGSGEVYRQRILRGIDYILAAQYPNGGWPQNWPLEGGFHDGITYNDNALTNVIELLDDVANGRESFGFVTAQIQARAATARDRGIGIILESQIKIHGVPTGWAQQVDALSLAPISARNYEPPSLASGESAALLYFLMSQENPSPDVRVAVHRGMDWLRNAAIYGVSWGDDPDNRFAIDRPGAGPIWARYYSLDTGLPIFGDRDKTIRDNVNEISAERRNGYAWYSGRISQVLARYEDWRSEHPS